jgi:methyl halide transferase
MSCSQSRQSNEIDSVNFATAASGPPLNRPLRETGELLLILFRDSYGAGATCKDETARARRFSEVHFGHALPPDAIDTIPPNRSMARMDWEEMYQKGDVFWDRGGPSLPLRQYLQRHPVRGRALVPGCGRGHEVALAVEHGLDAIGLDIAPTAIAEARAVYPHLADRFLLGSFFEPPEALRASFDLLLEHTCMSALHPSLRAAYRRGVDFTLRPGGLLVGVWYINPSLDPGCEGPPFPFSVEDLTTLFAQGYRVLEDYVPDIAFPGREGRERLRVLQRVAE